MSTFDHVYAVFVQATPDRVWRAITDGVETEQYYFGTRVGSTWTPGSRVTYEYPDGSLAADGIVLEIDPPNRLRMSFHARWDPDIEGSRTAADFSGGIAYIVSGLKTLIKTGHRLAVAAR